MRSNKMIKGVKKFGSDFFEGDFFGLAAEISFYLLSTFLPMIILVFTVASSISLNYTDAMFKVLQVLPKEVEKLIVSMLSSRTESNTVITITAFLSLTTMSGFILTSEKALIRFYQIEDTRGFWMSKITSVIFAILIFITIIASFGLIIFGRIIGIAIAKNGSGPEALKLWNLSRYLVLSLFIAIVICALYKTLPTVKIKLWEVLPGAVFTTIGWYVASFLFALYVNNFPQYEIIYGSLAGFACMIMWIYLISIVILAGAKINALIYRHRQRKREQNLAEESTEETVAVPVTSSEIFD